MKTAAAGATERIALWLTIFIEPGQTVEIRAPKAPGRSFWRFTDLAAAAELVTALSRQSPKLPAIYFTLNPVDPDLAEDKAAKDENILRRRWLLIDCDPKRPADTSATDEEKTSALELTERVRAYLDGQGWHAPVFADSGNGYHLLYRIDLPRDDGGLVKAVLDSLAAQFNTEACEIDVRVGNPSRICKLYGTVARKGKGTQERPHRPASVLEAPDDPVVISAELLQAVADAGRQRGGSALDLDADIDRKRKRAAGVNGEGSPWEMTHRKGGKVARGNISADVEARAIAYLDKCGPAISGSRGHNQAFKVACKIGPGFDLPPETTYRLLAEHFNPRCKPPWSEWELWRKVGQGYQEEPRRGWFLDAKRNGTGAHDRCQTISNGRSNRSNGSTRIGTPSEPPLGDEATDEFEQLSDEDLGIIRASSLSPENIEWLWTDRIALGKFTLTAGDGGAGKSQYAVQVAAAITTGGLFPDGSGPAMTGDVFILAAEDGARDTIIPRLMAAGADTGRVNILTASITVKDKNGKPLISPMSFQNLAYWRAVFSRRPSARLLIADPLPAYLGRGVNDHRNNEVRAVLEPFIALLGEHRIAMDGITHLGKSMDTKTPAHKILGSVAYSNLARTVHVAVQDPENKGRRVLFQVKNNLGPMQPALAFAIVEAHVAHEDETIRTSFARFESEPIDADAAEMMSAGHSKGKKPGPEPAKTLAVMEWLHDFLKDEGNPVLLAAVFDAIGPTGLLGSRGKDGKWTSQSLLYEARKRIPQLPAPRNGKRVDDFKARLKEGGKECIYWHLIGDGANDDSSPSY
jgi:hypothetical protein